MDVEPITLSNPAMARRYDGKPVPVPLEGAARIVWILGEHSRVRRALAPELHKAGEGGVYWSPARPFEAAGFRLVP